MRQAYLCVETNTQSPHEVRLFLSDTEPKVEMGVDAQRTIRFCARFNDAEAALMHTHDTLRHQLVDIDGHIYRATVEEAIAAIDSVELRHNVAYADPNLSEDSRHEIEAREHSLHEQHSRRDRFFDVLGYIGIGLLLFNILFIAR